RRVSHARTRTRKPGTRDVCQAIIPTSAFLDFAASTTSMRTFLLLLSALPLLAAPANNPAVKVFILAGQSNMEGKAKLSLLEYQIKQPATRSRFAHFQKDGQWITRDDVWIKFLD